MNRRRLRISCRKGMNEKCKEPKRKTKRNKKGRNDSRDQRRISRTEGRGMERS